MQDKVQRVQRDLGRAYRWLGTRGTLAGMAGRRTFGRAFAGLVLLGAVLTPSVAKLRLPSHSVSADIVGNATVVPNGSGFRTEILAEGKDPGFGRNTLVELDLPTVDNIGDVAGLFYLARFSGGDGRKKTGQGDHADTLNCEFTGFSVDTGTGVAYFGTATVISGTERFAGATGSFTVIVYQAGHLDTTIFFDSQPAEFIVDGEYALP